MESIDKWFGRKYKFNVYTCSDFTRDVWLDLTGVDLAGVLNGLLEAQDPRGIRKAHARRFRVLRKPTDPCLLIMQKPGLPAHLAVYIGGDVLQLTQQGVAFLTLKTTTLMAKQFRFIECKQ